MDRTDPLDNPADLDPRHIRPRHGHAPALWLALPLFAGCWLQAEMGFPAWIAWGIGGVACWFGGMGGSTGRWTLAAAGVALGIAWYAARAAETRPWHPRGGPTDLILRIERSESNAEGREGWWAVGLAEGGHPGALRRRILAEGIGNPPRAGSRSVLTGNLRADDGSSSWRRSAGISGILSRAHLRAELDPPSEGASWRARQAAALLKSLGELAWEQPRGQRLLAATLLGNSRLLKSEERAVFATTGTLHLFAISGLHIAGMAAVLLGVARLLRLPSGPATVAILTLLGAYVEVTGGAPSARRAWIMAVGLLACRAAERRPNPIQGLALAGAATLLLDPEAATDAGFQLSYLSVGGILLAGSPAARDAAAPSEAERLSAAGAAPAGRRVRGWLRARAAEGACLATSASVAGAPVAVALFGQISPGGILVNIVLIPLSTPPLALGMLSAALVPATALDPVRWVVNALAATWLEGMARIADWAAAAPGMSWSRTWVHPELAALCQAGLVALLLANAEARNWRRLLIPPTVWVTAWLMLGAR